MAWSTRGLPLLPGVPRPRSAAPSRSSYAKRQVWSAGPNNVCIERTSYRPASSYGARPAPKGVSFQVNGSGNRFARPQSAVTRPGSAASMSGLVNPPNWVRHDREVLRYFLYFKEAVHESASENYRVRKCTLFYYLEDGSIHIGEPKVENSGIPQGIFVKRRPGCGVEKDPETGACYAPADFGIGVEFTIFGRTFRVVDADKHTREFMVEEHAIELGAAEAYPDDPYSTMRKGVPRAVIESIRGAKAPDTLARFLKNDRKVLRFDAVWDDTAALYGEKRLYTLLYYLSDDTVQIREVPQKNSGRDNWPLLLKRGKLPLPGGGCKRYTTDEDLRVGKLVRVYGRDIMLTTADDFTKAYYRVKYGVELVDLPEPSAGAPAPRMDVPPPTGFGSDEDSLGSFYSLVPKPPKKNFHKMERNDKKVLRFSAKIKAAGHATDESRRFVIMYFLSDDTQSIFEQRLRNSGILGGKFLERGKYSHDDPADKAFIPRQIALKPADFHVGAVVSFNKYAFEVLEADGYTLKYMENKCGDFPLSNSDVVFGKLLTRLQSTLKHNNLRAEFTEFDKDGSGCLTQAEFKKLLARHGLYPTELNEQEVITLIRRFDVGNDGSVSYHELVDALTRMSPSKVQAQKTFKDLESLEGKLLYRLRADDVSLRAAFRDNDADHNGYITRDEFVHMLRDRFHLDVTEAQADYLMRRYDSSGEGMIDYNEFCDVVYQSDFESELSGTNLKGHVTTDESYGAIARGKQESKEAEDTSDAAMGIFATAFYNKQYLLRKNFRKMDADKSGFLTEEEFIDALELTNHSLSDGDKFALASRFFPTPDTLLSWSAFMKNMSEFVTRTQDEAVFGAAHLGSLTGH